MPVYDESQLDQINTSYLNNIHVVATHTAPTFVFPYTKEGVHHWMLRDMQLKYDLEQERGVMDRIFNKLKDNQERLLEWYYGHFHATQTNVVDNVKFCLLDICEFRELRVDF